jgi:hypothetical protein
MYVLTVTQCHLPLRHGRISNSHLQILVHRCSDCLLIRAHDLLDLLSVLEQQKCWHSPDVELLRNIRHLIDIDLVELHAILVLVFSGHGGDLRGNHLAGTAPGGEAVEQDEVGGGAADDGGLEGGFAGEGVNAFPCGFLRGCGFGRGVNGIRLSVLGTEFGLVVGYVLCEIVDAHFGCDGGELVDRGGLEVLMGCFVKKSRCSRSKSSESGGLELPE